MSDYPDSYAPGQEKDYEACDALSTLLRADAIKHCGDADLLSRINKEAHRQAAALDRVSALLSGITTGEEDELTGLVDRSDSRTIDDFLSRINRSRKEEYARNMQPLKGKGAYS